MNKTITARYPSNIALVKYWGKREGQIPCNPSVSMTLSKAFTEVKLDYTEKRGSKIEFEYLFEGKPQADFRSRILNYMQSQTLLSELLEKYAIRMTSENSFPHSAGIASSASSFAAIAAALLRIEEDKDQDFSRRASYYARLGSGSACRSFYGPFALWGSLPGIAGSGDEAAVPLKNIHASFKDMKDAILIVLEGKKKISSSEGHRLMEGHPFAKVRFEQAGRHCREMCEVLARGDFERFISITESEALTLHAMMMTSESYFWLFNADTIHIMEQILNFRKDTHLPVCFTLDAGPNVHLLYPDFAKEEVGYFIEDSLKKWTKSIIFDEAGLGGSVE